MRKRVGEGRFSRSIARPPVNPENRLSYYLEASARELAEDSFHNVPEGIPTKYNSRVISATERFERKYGKGPASYSFNRTR